MTTMKTTNTTDERAARRERIADQVLAGLGGGFNDDLFWYLVDHGTPQIDGGAEHQAARRFRDLISADDESERIRKVRADAYQSGAGYGGERM